MAQPARTLGFPARGVSNEMLMRMLRFPAVRSRISAALARATPEKVDAVAGRAYVRFRLADPSRFHPALMATIPVGSRGTLLVIGTPRSAVRKPRELEAFIRRMGHGMKTEARRSLIYQLRAAGIIGGAETQGVLVPRDRVLSAVRMYTGRASSRAAANPILATIGFNAPKCDGCGKSRTVEQRMDFPAVRDASGKMRAPWLCSRCLGKKRRSHPRRNAAGFGRGKEKWGTYAGGTAAAEGKHGQSLYIGQGHYSIQPISWPNGRHRGYLVHFIDDKGKLGRGLWNELGIARSPNAGKALCKAHFAKHFGGGKNPLTTKESVDLLRHAKYMEDRARRTDKATAAAYYSGEARGLARSVQRYGIKRAGRVAARIGGRSGDTAFAKGAYSNPGQTQVEIKVPFRDGQKITPARMREWVDSLPVNPITRLIKARFEKCITQYKRFHLGSEPTSFTYRAIPMGSQGTKITDVDMVVSEGKEWAAPYQVPKSSGKYDPNVQGRYIHAHGESKMDIDIKKAASTSKLPERFHTADGKFVGVVPSRNVKITDWYRG